MSQTFHFISFSHSTLKLVQISLAFSALPKIRGILEHLKNISDKLVVESCLNGDVGEIVFMLSIHDSVHLIDFSML